MAKGPADDLIDAASFGPIRRKLTEYSDKIDNAVDSVKNAWENNPIKQAYNKYTGSDKKKYVAGERERSLGFYPKSDAPKKKTAIRKKVATKK